VKDPGNGEATPNIDSLASVDDLIAEAVADPEAHATMRDTRDRLGLLRNFGWLRIQRGLSQREVARRMGTTQSAISELEKAVTEPRLATLQRYARILGYQLRFQLEPDRYQSRTFHYPNHIRFKTRRRRRDSDDPSRSAVAIIASLDDSHVTFARKDDLLLSDSLSAKYGTAAKA
jgi:transcriptional regulator with XRE-family HTH domain